MRSPQETGFSETHYACNWIEERLRVVRDLAQQVAQYPRKRTVHEARVACRRLREAIGFFAGVFGVPELPDVDRGVRRFAKALAPLREADVARERLAGLTLAEAGGRDRLLRQLARRRKKLVTRGAKRLNRRAEQLRQAIDARLPLSPSSASTRAASLGETELRVALLSRVDPREREVLRRWAEVAELDLSKVPAAQLHGVRIAIKHWRYALEIARAVLPRAEYQAIAARLRGLQSAGGKSQDWADVLELVREGEGERHAQSSAHQELRKAVKRELSQAVRAFSRALSRELAVADEGDQPRRAGP